jgi:hypothetical protein
LICVKDSRIRPPAAKQILLVTVSAEGNKMTRRYRSRALAAIHETAMGLREAGVISRRAMMAFHRVCLAPTDPASQHAHRRRKER